MNKNDIVVGETYLFLATTSEARKHLEGQPFTVVEKKSVFRRLHRGKRKVWRFFNEDGVGARAEELGEMPNPLILGMDFNAEAPQTVSAWYCLQCGAIVSVYTPPPNGQCPGCNAAQAEKDDRTDSQQPKTGLFAPVGCNTDLGDPAQYKACTADLRELPCPECPTGDMKHVETAPGGVYMRYRCPDCLYEVTFP